MSNHLNKITSLAKKIRKQYPSKKWTECVRAASKQLKGTQKAAPKKVSGFIKGKTRFLEVGEKAPKRGKAVRVIRRKTAGKPGTFRDFIKISGLFDTSIINDIDQLKKEYYKLAKKYHPDAGGTKEQFQALEAEYKKHFTSLLKGSKLSQDQQKNEIELDDALRAAANALAGIEGINIELAGKWLWVSGNTYPFRAQLKSAGFLFASAKKMWFYKGTESSGRGNMDIEEIRNKYGSTKISPDALKKISGIGQNIKVSAIKKARLRKSLKRAVKALNKRIV